jgi:hypothetical protein
LARAVDDHHTEGIGCLCDDRLDASVDNGDLAHHGDEATSLSSETLLLCRAEPFQIMGESVPRVVQPLEE